MTQVQECHRIETSGDMAAFASAREVAWHGLGTVTPTAMTAEDALSLAHLADWNMRHEPFVGCVGGEFIADTGRSFIVRDNPFDKSPNILGVTSPAYGIVSNEQACAFLDMFGDLGGAKFETAGSIEDGRRIFVTMRMPGELLVAGMDPVETYVMFTTTHDGSGSAEGLVIPNRVVCRNTLDLAMGRAKRRVRIRHTRNAAQRMQQAAELLSETEGYVGSFKASCERLAALKVSLSEVDAFLAELFPANEAPGASKASVTRAKNRRAAVRLLVTDSPTIQDEFRLTGWGVVNAVAEWQDWFAPVRGGETAAAKRRAIRSNIGDEGSKFKTKAAKLLLSV